MTPDSRFPNIPDELRQVPQWVNWRIESRKGKPTKVPKQPSGANASSTDSNTWSTFERVAQTNGQFNGIGFVFTKEAGYAGIDLDKCRDPKTAETEDWALNILSELDSYTELSQSGTGWHVIVKGTLPPGGNRKGRVEMYDYGRYFCMTGALVHGVGRETIESRDIAGLQERMLAGEFGSSSIAKPARDESESAEDFRLIGEVQKQLRTSNPAVLEEAFKTRYAERYAKRNHKKHNRVGKNYIRYSIEKFLALEHTSLSSMIKNERGKISPLLANAITALRYDAEWKGVLGFNEFSLYAVIRKTTPWGKPAGENWTDTDDIRTSEWLQHHGILVNPQVAGNAVQAVAEENRFHPVKEYLNALKWDGTKRLDTWLATYLGATQTRFIEAVGTRWLVSAVARIYQPGCQADHTLLLEGPQGLKKSKALRTLAGPEWFTDHLSDLDSKDSRLELHGVWIVELAELAGIRRSLNEKVKSFLTATTDHFRPPYGRRTIHVPRTNVFAGSVNDATPFTDETGNRRFWPVRCGTIDIEALSRDRDQLWAEVLQRYKDKAVWWLDTDELNRLASNEQEERYEPGVWDEVILAWLESLIQRVGWSEQEKCEVPIEPFHSTRDAATITDILVHGVGKGIEKCTQADRNQVARYLEHAGWKLSRKSARKEDGGRAQPRYYTRPTS